MPSKKIRHLNCECDLISDVIFIPYNYISSYPQLGNKVPTTLKLCQLQTCYMLATTKKNKVAITTLLKACCNLVFSVWVLFPFSFSSHLYPSLSYFYPPLLPISPFCHIFFCLLPNIYSPLCHACTCSMCMHVCCDSVLCHVSMGTPYKHVFVFIFCLSCVSLVLSGLNQSTSTWCPMVTAHIGAG